MRQLVTTLRAIFSLSPILIATSLRIGIIVKSVYRSGLLKVKNSSLISDIKRTSIHLDCWGVRLCLDEIRTLVPYIPCGFIKQPKKVEGSTSVGLTCLASRWSLFAILFNDSLMKYGYSLKLN